MPFIRRILATGMAACVFAGVFTLYAAPVNSAEAPSAKTETLVPHRAAYEITLFQSREGVGPTAARGIMAYTFADACESWVVENRIVMDVVYGEETPVRTDWTSSSWESKDGRDYGFNMTHKRNEQLAEELKGTARIDPGRGGEAAFTGNQAVQIPLPKETLFPTSHLLASLKAAKEGKKVFSKPMFDGGSLDNPYDTNAYIVRPKTRDKAVQKLLKKAGFADDVPVWRYQMAFFAQQSNEGTPAFELEVDYRADGIAERITQYFSDFAIRMSLVKLEKLAGGC